MHVTIHGCFEKDDKLVTKAKRVFFFLKFQRTRPFFKNGSTAYTPSFRINYNKIRHID